MTDFAARVEVTAKRLERAAIALGMAISGDGRISEVDAAKLLGLAAGYLKQLRSEGNGPANFRLGLNGCRLSYRLADVATWIEERRDSSQR
jgi:hypothetical protein